MKVEETHLIWYCKNKKCPFPSRASSSMTCIQCGEQMQPVEYWSYSRVQQALAAARADAAELVADAEKRGYERALERAERLAENINPASNKERVNGIPGGDAMGAIIEYRDKIRALRPSEAGPR